MNNTSAKYGNALAEEGIDFLASIFQQTAFKTTQDLLDDIVRGLGTLLSAETVFVAYALRSPPRTVRGVASWKNGEFGEAWEYDLESNPCQLVYRGEPVVIPCDVWSKYHKKRESGYESFIGVPLKKNGATIGHIAAYSSLEVPSNSFQMGLVRLCGYCIEREVTYVHEKDNVERLEERRNEQVKNIESIRPKATKILDSISMHCSRLSDQAPVGLEHRTLVNEIDTASKALRALLLEL